MPRHYGENHIENPEAYDRAVQASIYARATAKRQREWDAQHPELAAWLNFRGYTEIPLVGEELEAYRRDAAREGYDIQPNPVRIDHSPHPLGPIPSFVRDARNKWGSLTEGQTAALQRIYDERTQRNADREAQRAAEAATAQPWTAGRQVVEGVVISVKETEGYPAYYGATPPTVYKMLVKRDDGSKIYLTVPRGVEDAFFAAETTGLASWLRGKRVRFTAKVEPKAEEPTFAFGSRPTKGEVI